MRNDWEWIICATRDGKLPWSDNTACGHPPKWAPGGEMSYRDAAGARRNQWGGTESTSNRKTDGSKDVHSRPSHKLRTKGGSPKDSCKGRRIPAGTTHNGELMHEDSYAPPDLANPGNVIHCNVGGGVMGNPICALNEAPFPEDLVTFFVKSFCPPGGIVLDPFAGSGTTPAVAVREGRRALGCDLRQSQVDLCHRRIGGETPDMFESAKSLNHEAEHLPAEQE